MTDKRILVLRSTDILSTNTNTTYYGQTISNQVGIVSNNRDNMVWNNVNMRQLLGPIYDKYERFNISLVSAYVGVAQDAWLASALQPTQPVENIRNLVIKLGGFAFDAPCWSQKKGQTQLAPMGTILLNRLHDSEIIKGCGKPVLQQYPAESCQYTFAKSCDLASINIQLHNVSSDTFPTYELYGAPTAPRLHGHCIFMFSIEGVTFGTPEKRVLRLSTSDITTKNNTLDYVASANGIMDANDYGTISRSKLTTTWNNINIRATFGDDFYRRYKKYKINLNTCFITPQESGGNMCDLDTKQFSVYPQANSAISYTTGSFTPIVSKTSTMAESSTQGTVSSWEYLNSISTNSVAEMGWGDFPEPYFYPADGKTISWKNYVYIRSGASSTQNNCDFNDFTDGVTKLNFDINSTSPAGYKFLGQVYPISYESPSQMDIFFTLHSTATNMPTGFPSVKLGRCYGDPRISASWTYSTNATPTFATGSWKIWFVDTANQYVAFVNGDSLSAQRSVYIYNNYNLSGTPTIINLAGSNDLGLRTLLYQFRKPYAILAPYDTTTDGKAFLLNYTGSGTISWTMTDAYKSTLISSNTTMVAAAGYMNAMLTKFDNGWNICYFAPVASYVAASSYNIEHKWIVWDGVQGSTPEYQLLAVIANNTNLRYLNPAIFGVTKISAGYYSPAVAMIASDGTRDTSMFTMRSFDKQATIRTYVSGGAVGTNTVVLNSTLVLSNNLLLPISGTGLPEGTYVIASAGTTYTLSANFTVQASGNYISPALPALNSTSLDNGQIASYTRFTGLPQSSNFVFRLLDGTFTTSIFAAELKFGTVGISSTSLPSENRDLSVCLNGLAYSAPTYSTPQFINGSTALMRTFTLPNLPSDLFTAGTQGQQNNIYDKPIAYTFQKWSENIPLTINLYDITDRDGLTTMYGVAFNTYDQYCSKIGDQLYLFDVEGVEEEENM